MNKYPSREEMRDVFRNTLPPVRVRSFFRDRGILLLSQRHEHLGESGSGFFFGQADLDELKELMDDERNYRKSGQMFVPAPSKMDDIVNALAQRSRDIAPDRRVSVHRDGDGRAVVEVTYVKRKPGMNSMLEDQKHKVTFVVERQDKRVAIHVSHQERGEFRAVEKLLESTVSLVRGNDGDQNLTLQQVKLKGLTLEERIDLFNRFFVKDYENWRLVEVLKVSLKREETDDEEDEVVSDRESSSDEATPGQLSGLTTAVLEGTGLRENEFVKQCLASRFYFSGAKLRLRHRREAKVVDIEISFRAGFAEISICQSGLLENDRPQWSPFPKDEQDLINLQFHRLLGEMYRDIVNGRRSVAAG